MNELIKLQEAAKLLDVHVNTLRSLIRTGDLPAYKIGSKLIRVKRQEVLDLLVQKGN